MIEVLLIALAGLGLLFLLMGGGFVVLAWLVYGVLRVWGWCKACVTGPKLGRP